MWHLKYKDGHHVKFDTWGECQPIFARDATLITECWQDGKKQTFAEQVVDIGNALKAST